MRPTGGDGGLNRHTFPPIALALAVPLLLALFFGAQTAPDGGTRLPLLTLLLISEFGSISSAAGTWLALQRLLRGEAGGAYMALAAACAVATGLFVWQLVRFWPL